VWPELAEREKEKFREIPVDERLLEEECRSNPLPERRGWGTIGIRADRGRGKRGEMAACFSSEASNGDTKGCEGSRGKLGGGKGGGEQGKKKSEGGGGKRNNKRAF